MGRSDDYKQIQMCLNCPHVRCINCLDHTPMKRGMFTVERIDPETREVTAVYTSYAEAGRQNNVNPNHIGRYVTNQRLYGGYYWKTTLKE